MSFVQGVVRDSLSSCEYINLIYCICSEPSPHPPHRPTYCCYCCPCHFIVT